LRNHLALLVSITLNCQVVGFDIGCHEAIITLMTNSMCTTVVEVTKNIHETVIWPQPMSKPTT